MKFPDDPLALLGKRVVVTLDNDDDTAIAKGTLMRFCDGGEVVVLDDMGFLNYCWPMLRVAEDEA